MPPRQPPTPTPARARAGRRSLIGSPRRRRRPGGAGRWPRSTPSRGPTGTPPDPATPPGRPGRRRRPTRTGAQLSALMAGPPPRPTRRVPTPPGPCSSRGSTPLVAATAPRPTRPARRLPTRRRRPPAQFSRVMAARAAGAAQLRTDHRPPARHGAAAGRRRPVRGARGGDPATPDLGRPRPPTEMARRRAWPSSSPTPATRACAARSAGRGTAVPAAAARCWVPPRSPRPRSGRPRWRHGGRPGRVTALAAVHHWRSRAVGLDPRRSPPAVAGPSATVVRARGVDRPGRGPRSCPRPPRWPRGDRDQLRDRGRVGRRGDGHLAPATRPGAAAAPGATGRVAAGPTVTLASGASVGPDPRRCRWRRGHRYTADRGRARCPAGQADRPAPPSSSWSRSPADRP